MEDEEKDPQDSSFPFFLLKGIRFKIIQLLYLKKSTFNELKERLIKENNDDIANYSLQLHLQILQKNDFIKRDQSNYILTNMGNQIFEISSSLQFLWINQNYFTEHSLRDLPARFYLSIGIFKDKVKIINGHPIVFRKLLEMYSMANEFIYNILYWVEGTIEIREILKSKLKENKSFCTKTIFGSNTVFDPNRHADLIDFESFKKSGQIKQKKINTNIRISVVITDKSAFIIFPKVTEDHPDMNMILFGEDSEFRRWCLDYFYYCWSIADEEIIIK